MQLANFANGELGKWQIWQLANLAAGELTIDEYRNWQILQLANFATAKLYNWQI